MTDRIRQVCFDLKDLLWIPREQELRLAIMAFILRYRASEDCKYKYL